MTDSLKPGLTETSRFLKQRTLIVGDVNTGKTTLTGRMLRQAVDATGPDRICIVDLSPTISAESVRNIGGRLAPPGDENVLYLTDIIRPPRLSTHTEEEAEAVARRNKRIIEPLFEAFAAGGRDVLFVNDVSLYLQAGRPDHLTTWLSRAETVVANGYHGRSLGRGRLSQTEHRRMERLMAFFDRVIRLEKG